MSTEKKSSFKTGFVSGAFWGASVVLFAAAIFYFAQWKNNDTSALYFILYCLAGVIVSFISNKVFKKLN
jgi:hypothetical protein